MSNPPAQSPLEHGVITLTSLLAVYICVNTHQAVATDQELRNIIAETIWEAKQDILRQPALGAPWSEHLRAFWDILLADTRAMPTLVSKLFAICLDIFILLPVFLLYNITRARCAVKWTLKLVGRWYVCLKGYHELSTTLRARIRASALQELPGLTGDEADRMVTKVTMLAVVARLLGVPGI